MLALKLITLLITVSTGLKAVPFGEIRSAQTLFSSPSLSTSPAPLSTLINTDSFLHNDTKEEHTPSETLIDKDELESQPQLDDHADQDEGFDMNRHFHNKDGDDWGLYVPINLEGSKTIVRRAVGLEKRAMARGTVHLDCKNAPEVCKNAGCYQNCLRKAKGNNKSFYYTNGPLEITKNARGRTLTPQANENRFNSGVALSWSRPCRAWPFAQKFWHPQDFKGLGPELDLETDEWPMATMRTAGSNEVMRFRRAQGPDSNYFPGGLWANDRPGGSLELALGDTYYVMFDFSSFPKKGDPEYQKWVDIRKTLKYAEWTQDSGCNNDGLQFHMSKLRPSGNNQPTLNPPQGRSHKPGGKMIAPYDTEVHNNYRLSEQGFDIEQYFVRLTISGKAQDQVNAEVFYRLDGSWTTLAQKSARVKPTGVLRLQGNLPKALEIYRRTNGCEYQFTYAEKSDGIRRFKFSSYDKGYGKWKKRDAKDIENYCDESTEKGVTTILCSFPGW